MKRIVVLLAVLSVFLLGCKSQVDATDNSTVNFEAIGQLNTLGKTIGSNAFAFDLYAKLQEGDDNIFFSPWSISSALAMTYEGARGQTAEEIRRVFNLPENDTVRRESFAALYGSINRKDVPYKLSAANALWVQESYPVLPEYVSTIGRYYNGKATNLDFAGKTETSRQTINIWVENQTNKKIKDLLPRGSITYDARLVLTNAVYFKGEWVTQFNKQKTRQEDFTTGKGDSIKVPMMQLTDSQFNYGETDGLQILELPYKGGNVSMLILLPKQKLNLVEQQLSEAKLAEWQGMLQKRKVAVFIPKFTFSEEYSLVETLQSMGMRHAFIEADFSGIDGTKSLAITEVVHKAFVDVNEEGTEAAAATGVVIGITSAEMTPVFRADHPFIFLIQDKSTGTILFIGRVTSPA